MQLQEYVQNLDAARVERIASLVGGSALISFGLSRRSLLTLPLALVGGGLVYHGIRGNRVMDYEERYDGEKGMPTGTSVAYGQGICVEREVAIDKSPEELYRFWRNLENLPRFMSHLREVHVLDDTHSHWVADAPAGMKVEWDAEIINDIPNEVIGWRSMPNAEIPNAGSVHFTRAPGNRGTIVKVEMQYDPPGGPVGAAFAKMFGVEPSEAIYTDLQHLKQTLETGEIATTMDQPRGSRNPFSKFMPGGMASGGNE